MFDSYLFQMQQIFEYFIVGFCLINIALVFGLSHHYWQSQKMIEKQVDQLIQKPNIPIKSAKKIDHLYNNLQQKIIVLSRQINK